MERGEWDKTLLMEFLLLGLGDACELQTLLFLLSLTMCLITVTMVGNILIIVLVVIDPHLHTPMYFFLVNLSSLETCSSSTILPRLLASFLTGNRTISVQGCTAQFFFFGTFATSECYLLAAMSYDWYLAICQPLLYARRIMSFISCQRFCGPGAIDHFFCEEAPLLELSCGDTLSFPDVVFPFLFTLASYVCIIAPILRNPSSMGRHKAFSTCSSHLTTVIVFYWTLNIVYMLSRTVPLRQLNKMFSFSYTVPTPLINPLIYSLRNREVKGALGRVLRRAAACTDSSNQVWISGHKSSSPAN
ncbi:PREDICTED: olfactory receptor 5F1-like [Pterocles gutturalis]|uniref:olfactory receptor 5F1-like n=1 Tax=Pterocles gutturalis TaxID=240206 RepID=UPI000528EA12|nr:PREDICTED: olfactory receptor 5F1-like [Pterocles gutturalis]